MTKTDRSVAMDGETGSGPRIPLAGKLAVALVLCGALMLSVLMGVFAPRTARDFQARSDALIDRGTELIRRMASEDTLESQQILVDVIRHGTDARMRTMADLPLSLYGGDTVKIRRAIEDADAARGERQTRNAVLLAREMKARRLARIDSYLESVARDQRQLASLFASDARRSYSLVVALSFSALLVILGLGLMHSVVRPVRRLQRVAQAVANGDLTLGVRSSGRDEVGDLADDLGRMIGQLRASREELTRLNRGLEAEVDRKTRHLRDALDNLKAAQRQLVHAEKMASLGTLAGGVAHEFNNLIGGIRGCAREALADEVDPRRKENLEVILRASDRAARVTEQLLRFSEGRIGHRRPVPVSEMVDECLQLLRFDSGRLGVEVETEVPEGLHVHVDPGAMGQVLLNLLRNALQAMPGGGRLQVAAGAEGSSVVIRIRDTGCGVSDEHVERVFEPFFTTRGDETEGFLRGSGLGLSVSYGLVEAHGGSLELESTSAAGTVFAIRLPVRSEEAPDAGGC